MSRRRRGARLEMTSLMDVVFLVLVFFVYSVFDMAVHRGMKVELPEGGGILEKGERIVVTILPDDTFQLDGEAIARGALVAAVAGRARGDDAPPVLISGDKNSSLGAGIGLLSELKGAGVGKVTFRVAGADSGDWGPARDDGR